MVMVNDEGHVNEKGHVNEEMVNERAYMSVYERGKVMSVLLNPSRQIPASVTTRKSDASRSSSSYLIQVDPTPHHGVYVIFLLFDR